MKPRRRGRPQLYKTPAARYRAYRRRLALKVYHRSQCATWETPPEVFGPLEAEFHFTLDVCAQPETAKCPRYFTPEDDGLAQPWEGICWMNPPYGRGVEQWIRKAYESSLTGATVVCLVKATPDTRWWHAYTPHAEVRWVPGRVRFVGAPGPAPFPVCGHFPSARRECMNEWQWRAQSIEYVLGNFLADADQGVWVGKQAHELWDGMLLIPQTIRQRVEIKADWQAARTGNIYLETCNTRWEKPSGLTATHADLWVHYPHGYQEDGKACVLVFAPQDMLQHLERHATLAPATYRLTARARGDQNSQGYVVPLTIITHLPFVTVYHIKPTDPVYRILQGFAPVETPHGALR
jgi:phage N-6-adenine-methyltransferase